MIFERLGGLASGVRRRTIPSAAAILPLLAAAVAILVAPALMPQALATSRAAAPPADLESVKRLLEEGRPSDAETTARMLLREAEKRSGMSSPEVADVLDQLAVALRRAGKAAEPESRSLCERAVRVREQSLGTENPSYALSLQNLGALLFVAGKFAEAREPLERALAILEGALGTESLEVATSLSWVAYLRIKSGDPTGAEPLLRRVITTRTRILGPRDPAVAEGMDALASALYDAGDFAGAAPLYEAALEILKASRGPDHLTVAAAHHNSAALLSDMGDYEGGLNHINEALRIRIVKLGRNHPVVATDLDVMAYILERLGDFDGARSRYEQSLAIETRVYGRRNTITSQTQVSLGLLYLAHHDASRAKPLLQSALEVQESALGEDYHWLAMPLIGLAAIAAEEGDNALAERMYRRALAIRERALGPMNPDVAIALSRYADFLAGAGNPDSALRVGLRASGVSRTHLGLTARGLSERQALAYSSTRPHGLGTAISLLTNAPPNWGPREVQDVWDAVIRSRTLVLDEMAIRQRTASAQAGDTSIATEARALESSRQRLSNLLVRGIAEGSVERYQATVAKARAEVERAERRLASKSLAYREEQVWSGIGFSEVANALPQGSGLVAYVGYVGPHEEKGYVAFVMVGGGEPAAVHLGAAMQIDASVLRWVASVSSAVGRRDKIGRQAESDCRTAGTDLRRRVWDPVAARLGNLERVYVVPDGSLYRVSLAGLPIGSTKYLVETGPLIHYLSSERDLVRSDEKRLEGTSLFALGGPEFDGPVGARTRRTSSPDDRRGASRGAETAGPGSDCPDFRTIRFMPLPGAAREANEIASLWSGPGQALVVTGSGATEAEFKRQAPGRRVLHLATHGFFLGSECNMAAGGGRGIGGVSTKKPQQPRKSKARTMPLQLSGFALAGANLRNTVTPDQEDGVLTAEEIASLDLSSVQLAVLSACDTGVGTIQVGEGVLGLRRAFQVAGVRTTIMSLWAVEDQSTREWMNAFYSARFRSNHGTAEAVREASLRVLRDRRAQAQSTVPVYWAAFVAAGDWN